MAPMPLIAALLPALASVPDSDAGNPFSTSAQTREDGIVIRACPTPARVRFEVSATSKRPALLVFGRACRDGAVAIEYDEPRTCRLAGVAHCRFEAALVGGGIDASVRWGGGRFHASGLRPGPAPHRMQRYGDDGDDGTTIQVSIAPLSDETWLHVAAHEQPLRRIVEELAKAQRLDLDRVDRVDERPASLVLTGASVPELVERLAGIGGLPVRRTGTRGYRFGDRDRTSAVDALWRRIEETPENETQAHKALLERLVQTSEAPPDEDAMPAPGRAYAALIRIALDEDELERAMHLAERWRSRLSGHEPPADHRPAVAHLRIAGRLEQAGRYDDARRMNEQAMALVQESEYQQRFLLPVMLLDQAAHLARAGDEEARITALERANVLAAARPADVTLTRSDARPNVMSQLALAYATTGRYEDAARLQDRIANLLDPDDPSNDYARWRFVATESKLHRHYDEIGDSPRVVRHGDRFLRYGSSDRESPAAAMAPDILARTAHHLELEGRYEEAADYRRRLIAWTEDDDHHEAIRWWRSAVTDPAKTPCPSSAAVGEGGLRRLDVLQRLRSMAALSVDAAARDDYRGAARWWRRVLAERAEVFGPSSAAVADGLRELAFLQQQAGDETGARDSLAQASAIAIASDDRDRTADAGPPEPYLDHGLSGPLRQRLFDRADSGDDDADRAVALERAGDLLHMLGGRTGLAEAADAYRRAQDLRQRPGGGAHEPSAIRRLIERRIAVYEQLGHDRPAESLRRQLRDRPR